MTKPAKIYAAAAIAIVAAVLLNPTPDQHRARIKEAVAERSPLAGLLGVGALAAFVSTYHPLGVASYTTVDGHLVSVGFFGTVFVLQPSKGA
ncbi:MAG: hypothetical protein HGA47_06450 [Zoogloea sp.]|nr:hypothetical protein [Zoogloea sp.]